MPHASVTSNHGPRTILSPVRLLARKAEWIARRNFTSVLFWLSHQAACHDCARMVWSNNSQDSTGSPCDARAGIAPAPYGIFNIFHILPLRSPHGLFTGCLQSLNPYGARKLIMHALKLYGLRTGRQNSYGAARGPCGRREWTYDFCSKQSGNSPHGARECDVTESSSLTGIARGLLLHNISFL